MANGIFHDGRPEDPEATAARFLALRRKLRFNQKRLGRYISACRQTVSRIENGLVIPYGSTWRRFVAYEATHNQAPRTFPKDWWTDD
jgi:DNA-binding XRE family transcriptional regulator